MKFASLGSGSKGNATVVSSARSNVLIDCGFSAAETARRLQRLGLQADELDAVLLTHEHGDHSSGALTFCRRHGLPLFSSWGTCAALQDRGADFSGVLIETIAADAEFEIDDLNIRPVLVPHDAREPLQFLFRSSGKQLGILTDIGRISAHVRESFAACHGLLLECNHDLELLRTGPYPPSLKARVGGDWGHLNNRQAQELLNHMSPGALEHLAIGHISEKNNCMQRVRDALSPAYEANVAVYFADQSSGFNWIDLQGAEQPVSQSNALAQ